MKMTKKALSRPGKTIRRISLGLGVVFVVCICEFLQNRFAAENNAASFRSLKDAYTNESLAFAGTLKICTFNIAHGRGTNDNNLSDAKVRRERLLAIGQLLKERQIDVAVLNEVDFDAVWTGGEDQADIIAKAGGFGYVMEQRNFDMALPFLRLRFGNAILSRYEIKSAKLVTLPVYSKLESRFAGAKKAAYADISLGDGVTVRLLAVHMDPRSEDLRVRCADAILECANDSQYPFICAGDFNSGPVDFPNAAKSAVGTSLIDVLTGSNLLNTHAQSPTAEDALTFASYDPKQVIDWILFSSNWQLVGYDVSDVVMSDHRPVVMTLRLNNVK